MKRKLFMAGLAAALVFGLALTACDNGVQDVKQTYDKANAVASVTARQTDNKAYVVVSWDAVEDAGDYEVFYRQQNVKTVDEYGNGGQYYNTYAPANGNETNNDNPDKWSARISVNNYLTTGKSYEFGVRTSPFTQNGHTTYSNIVWSSPVTVAAP
jgi:hypothetical protein